MVAHNEMTAAYTRGQQDMQRRAAMAALRSAGTKLSMHDINLLQQAAQTILDLDPTLTPALTKEALT